MFDNTGQGFGYAPVFHSLEDNQSAEIFTNYIL